MLVRESEDGGGKDQFSRDKTQPGHHATQTSKEKEEEKNKNDEKRKIHKKERKKEITKYKTSFHIVIALFVKQNVDMQLLHKIELKGNEGKEKNMKIRI